MECLVSEFENRRKNEKVKSFQGHLKRKKNLMDTQKIKHKITTSRCGISCPASIDFVYIMFLTFRLISTEGIDVL